MASPQAPAQPPAGFHFQLYVVAGAEDVRWRLLSGNNRDVGRGARGFGDAEECVLALKELLSQLPELTPLLRRKAATNRWVWTLRRGETAVAESSHSYDRQIRAEAARLQFVARAPTATVSSAVMSSASRRGAGPARRSVPPNSARELL